MFEANRRKDDAKLTHMNLVIPQLLVQVLDQSYKKVCDDDNVMEEAL